jgi:hypothetical protein
MASGNVFTYRADGRYSLGPGNKPSVAKDCRTYSGFAGCASRGHCQLNARLRPATKDSAVTDGVRAINSLDSGGSENRSCRFPLRLRIM